ncbi:UNVERIFIED_CONTAM: hypothetical protein FKN15_060786 [Acipenser sinensis]
MESSQLCAELVPVWTLTVLLVYCEDTAEESWGCRRHCGFSSLDRWSRVSLDRSCPRSDASIRGSPSGGIPRVCRVSSKTVAPLLFVRYGCANHSDGTSSKLVIYGGTETATAAPPPLEMVTASPVLALDGSDDSSSGSRDGSNGIAGQYLHW